MINFRKLSYKNFLSTGNQPNEWFLDRTPSVLITGTNGAGKSTILDALCFGLYGKPYRNINKPQLVNTVNDKNCLVEIEFDVNEVPYRVVRGIKPGIFEIYRNGQLIQHDAAAKDYQRRLEDIVSMNYKAFTQIVIIGSARYQSFMDLGPNDRRTIIEEILDITVFSKMNSVLKVKTQNNDLEIKENDYQKDINKTKIDGQLSLIRSINNRNKESEDKINQEKDRMRGEISLLMHQSLKHDSDIDLIAVGDIEALNNALSDVKSKANEVAKKGKEFDKRITFYESTDVCHSCEQTLSDELKNKQIEKYTADKQKLVDLAPVISDAIKKAQTKYDEAVDANDKLSAILQNKRDINNSIKTLENAIKSLDSNVISDTTEELDDAKELLSALKDTQNILEKETVALAEEKHSLEICKILLKDDGIKAKIIKQYLPVMNNLINKHLDRMGANYSFHLDESFNEVIKSRYRDTFSYSSFSEGEKSRIDISLMLTWREVARLKNSITTNLLILDEVGDSSLDGEGTDVLWDILSESDDTNLFVISHKTSNTDKFTSHVEVHKDGNFTKIRNSK